VDLGVAGQGYLIVGGTAGMGLATAQVLAADGARLVIAGRNGDRAEAAAESLRRDHQASVIGVAADVSRPDTIDGLMDQALAFLGQLAGVAVTTGTGGHQPIEISDEEWSLVFEDVMMGPVRVVRSALPHLVAGGGGTIVTTSAYSIREPQRARLPYGSLKGALAVFTKGVARAYGEQGIRANCVCPGAIETDGMHAMRAQVAAERGYPYDEAIERVMVEDWGMDVALGRPGRAEEVGELIAFLLSPRAGYLTGALINIDGGTAF
jgi:3-oxoacyl-[acyl-carrier protein] reductase